MDRRCRTVPVVQHLGRQHGIEHEARHEAIQDELVVHLLQRRKDAAQTTGQIVEDGEGAELTGPALPVHRDDLRQLGRDAQHARAGLERRHHRGRDECVRDDECVDGSRDERDKGACQPGSIREVQDQDGDGDVLDEDEGCLAVGAEGEGVAGVVGERDEEGRRLEEVGGEAEALRGLGAQQLEDLRDLDDGGGGDDGEAEGFGDRETEAFGMGGYVEVEEEGAVALGPEERDEGVVDGSGKVGGDGGEVGFQWVKDERLDLIHGTDGKTGVRWT